jgi:ABC-2 type transport system permease protein
MALGYTAYLAIFVGLGLIVSSLSRSSRIALATLLVFWVANSVVPRKMSDLASRRYPLPSSAEMVNAMNAQMREGVDGHDPENARTDELRASLLAQYGVTDERQLPVNFDGISLQAGEEYGSAIFDRFYGELWTQIRRQNRLRLTGAVVSPLAAIQPWSLALAGMDWMHQERFAAAAETYRRRLVKTMNDELSYRSQAAPYEAVQRGREFWLAMPDFTYTPPPLSDVLHEVRGAALMLAGWLAAIAIGCVLAAGQIGRVFKW